MHQGGIKTPGTKWLVPSRQTASKMGIPIAIRQTLWIFMAIWKLTATVQDDDERIVAGGRGLLCPGQNGLRRSRTADSAIIGVNNNYAMALTEAQANSLHRDAAQTGLSTRTLPCNGGEHSPGVPSPRERCYGAHA